MSEWEGKVLLWVQDSVRTRWLTPFFRAVSRTCDHGEVWILLTVLFLLFRPTRRDGYILTATLAFEFLTVNVVLKNLIARPRPYDVVNGLFTLISAPRDYSFPSGHTAVSFAFSTAVFLSGYSRFGWVCYLFSALIGFSRLYLGVHYPTDVLAGGLIGSVVAVCVRLLLLAI